MTDEAEGPGSVAGRRPSPPSPTQPSQLGAGDQWAIACWRDSLISYKAGHISVQRPELKKLNTAGPNRTWVPVTEQDPALRPAVKATPRRYGDA